MTPIGRALAALLLATAAAADDEPPKAPDEEQLEATHGAGEATPDKPEEQGQVTPDGLRSEDLTTRASGRPDHPRTLEEIVKSGYIRMLTRNNDTSFFIYRGHRMGFDYEMGKKLAQSMGIRVDMVITSDWNEMVPALLRGEGDVIAAQLTVTEERKGKVLFANPWGQTHEVIVYRNGETPIEHIAELAGKEVYVRKGSTYEDTLRALNARFEKEGKPRIKAVVLPGEIETDTILERVSQGVYAYTLADENLADIHVAFWANLVKGPAVSDERDLAWALRPGDVELRERVDAFLRDIRRKPEFNIYKHRYFAATRSFKKSRNDRFYASETGTLSPYDDLIKKHAQRHGFDWRLVAAHVYQESHFDPKGKSWVGATGLFQLMPATARQLGVKNPTDPEQSIRGGLKYMKQLMKHYKDIPDDVERYRFAMAAYNTGFGHVDDARKLARRAGDDHKSWRAVAKWLLRLSKREYHRKTRFGFCRGFEPVDYVRHIDERYAGYAQLVPLDAKAEAQD